MCGHLHLHFTAFHRHQHMNIKQSLNVISFQYLHILFSRMLFHSDRPICTDYFVLTVVFCCTLIIQNSHDMHLKLIRSIQMQHTNYTNVKNDFDLAFKFCNTLLCVSFHFFCLFFLLSHNCEKYLKKEWNDAEWYKKLRNTFSGEFFIFFFKCYEFQVYFLSVITVFIVCKWLSFNGKHKIDLLKSNF